MENPQNPGYEQALDPPGISIPTGYRHRRPLWATGQASSTATPGSRSGHWTSFVSVSRRISPGAFHFQSN